MWLARAMSLNSPERPDLPARPFTGLFRRAGTRPYRRSSLSSALSASISPSNRAVSRRPDDSQVVEERTKISERGMRRKSCDRTNGCASALPADGRILFLGRDRAAFGFARRPRHPRGVANRDRVGGRARGRRDRKDVKSQARVRTGQGARGGKSVGAEPLAPYYGWLTGMLSTKMNP